MFLKVFGDNVPFSNALYLLEKRKHAVKSLRDVVVLTFLFLSLDNNSLCLAVVTVPFIVRIFSFICTISFPLFSVSLLFCNVSFVNTVQVESSACALPKKKKGKKNNDNAVRHSFEYCVSTY